MSTSEPLSTEIVLIGYEDSRLGRSVPIGFVLAVGCGFASAHQLEDITPLGLPVMFEFTVKHLIDVIASKSGEPRSKGTSLYDHLRHICFDTVGSLRCWQPVIESVDPRALDAYVDSWKHVIDSEFERAAEDIGEFTTQVKIDWVRIPRIEVIPPEKVPSVTKG